MKYYTLNLCLKVTILLLNDKNTFPHVSVIYQHEQYKNILCNSEVVLKYVIVNLNIQFHTVTIKCIFKLFLFYYFFFI